MKCRILSRSARSCTHDRPSSVQLCSKSFEQKWANDGQSSQVIKSWAFKCFLHPLKSRDFHIPGLYYLQITFAVNVKLPSIVFLTWTHAGDPQATVCSLPAARMDF